ncbi:MAG: polysaccharide deacetylase family protein [Chitinophagaceae bacterium]
MTYLPTSKENGLTVLMYHKTISAGPIDSLTVTSRQLEDQFQFLKDKGYNCVSVQEVIDHLENGTPLKKRPLILTFDDGYKNNYTVLYPLLKKHNLKAIIFLVPDLIDMSEGEDNLEYMSIQNLRTIDPAVIEFGLHTFDHKSYNKLELDTIEEDIIKTKNWFETNNISYVPAHAYTYGDFPKGNKTKLNALFNIFKSHGIKAAFNIGNRINTLPLKSNFVIQRIDVRGTESLSKFISKVKRGKVITGFVKDILGKP